MENEGINPEELNSPEQVSTPEQGESAEEISSTKESSAEQDASVDGAAKAAAVKAAVEAVVYVAEEPVTVAQITEALGSSSEPEVRQALAVLQEDCKREDRGLEVREIAGGYKMYTKPEHHETIRKFVQSLTPPLKLSMAALETLATIAYRQPATLPEIQQIRGVNASGVLKTLLERKLITTAGRKNVIGRPILYKTTKEFLIKFGLSGLGELPTLEEFGELAREAMEPAATASTEQQDAPLFNQPPDSPGAEKETSAAAEAEAQDSAGEAKSPPES